MSNEPVRDLKSMELNDLSNDATLRVYASILESAKACGLYNVVGNELFLMLTEYKGMIDAFRVTLEQLEASPTDRRARVLRADRVEERREGGEVVGDRRGVGKGQRPLVRAGEGFREG